MTGEPGDRSAAATGAPGGRDAGTPATETPLLQVRGLEKHYPVRERASLRDLLPFVSAGQERLKAVDGVSFDVREGEVLGLAGQSGCGKSTLGELLAGLLEPTAGTILFRGEDLAGFGSADWKAFRRNCQVVFQDPYESLNPRFTVYRTVAEPLRIHGVGETAEECERRVVEALADAGIRSPGNYLEKRPAELSGGERQRVSIARALVLDPAFVVADEPVSMLDVSTRAAILNTFREIQETRDLTVLFVSHDLKTLRFLADRTMIMYLGEVVEVGPTEAVIERPAHPYTDLLLGAVPGARRRADEPGSYVERDAPDPVDLPSGCRFHPRCPRATERCVETEPSVERVRDEQRAACHHPLEE